MLTQYLVLDPESGKNIPVDTLEEAYAQAATIAINFYLSQCHNTPITILNTDDQGLQTLQTIDGTIIFQNLEPTARSELVNQLSVTKI